MNYIICKQDLYNNISYITDDMTMPDEMEYNNFLNYIRPFIIYKWEDFVKELNCFNIIQVEYPEGNWIKKEDNRDYHDFSKEELYKLNTNTEKKQTIAEKVCHEKVNKGKRFLQRFRRHRR